MAVKKQFRSFEEMLQSSEQPLLVDFFSPDCGPCQAMVPVLEEVAAQTRDRLTITKIDIDRYPNLAMQHRIRAVPTLILFKEGQEINRFQGLVSPMELLERVRPHI